MAGQVSRHPAGKLAGVNRVLGSLVFAGSSFVLNVGGCEAWWAAPVETADSFAKEAGE